ncbi:MAG: PrsW family glutamic-type intramembrane protease [Dehalococcoidia bacterium]
MSFKTSPGAVTTPPRPKGVVAPPVLVPTAAPRRPAARWVVVRWSGAIFSTTVLISSLRVAGVYIGELTEAGADAPVALAVLLLSLGFAAIFGMGLMYVAMPGYAKVAFALLALFLVTAGALLLLFAPVVRQMNTPGLAEYRASNTFAVFGALSLATGLALGALCLRWALERRALRLLARWARLLGSAYGVLLGISGIGVIWTLLALIGEDTSAADGEFASVVQRALAITSIAMMSLIPGLILTYHGISSSMGEGSDEHRPPIFLLAAGAFGLAVVLGGWNMASGDPIAAPMPALHVLGAGLPGIAYLALASRGSIWAGTPVRGITWRELTLAMALSMTVGVGIALYVEGIGGFAAVVLALVHADAFAGVGRGGGVWDVIEDSNYLLSDNELLVTQLVAAAVIAPLIEEFSKGLGVRFLIRSITTRSQAFVLGAAAGAAFGFLEAMLYVLAFVGEDESRWWEGMLVRGGSTSLHVFATGLVGLAWWYWAIGKRPRRALALFAIAVAAHGMWNGTAVIIDSRIFGLDTLDYRTLEIVAYCVIAPLALAFIVALPVIARRIRDAPTAPVAGTPLASMAPWLG